MNTIFVHRDGRTEAVTSIDRSWLAPAADVYIWVDLAAPSIPESLVLTDTFMFHRLAVEQTRLPKHSPKIDAYDGYLFAAIAGADADTSVFVGPRYIVSVHWEESKAVADLIDSVRHGGKQFAEGPFAMFHRLVHASLEGCGALMAKHAACADGLQARAVEKPSAAVLSEILRARREVFEFRQRLSREHDAIRRLAGGDVVDVSAEMAVRFRHAEHHLAGLADEGAAIEHRLGDLLAAASALAARKSWI